MAVRPTRAESFTANKKQTEYFSDFLNSFAKTPVGDKLARVTNEQSVNQSLRNIIKTINGERLFNPDFGSQVLSSLFEPNDFFQLEMCIVGGANLPPHPTQTPVPHDDQVETLVPRRLHDDLGHAPKREELRLTRHALLHETPPRPVHHVHGLLLDPLLVVDLDRHRLQTIEPNGPLGPGYTHLHHVDNLDPGADPLSQPCGVPRRLQARLRPIRRNQNPAYEINFSFRHTISERETQFIKVFP